MDLIKIRNINIISHVDHGKATLKDRLLHQCSAEIPHERALDSISLEQKCGITISSKVTSIYGKDNELDLLCKTVHLVRHAQGIHNVEGEKDHRAYMSLELLDAHLTPLGWDQYDNLRKHVKACGLLGKLELVIVSPLLRTVQIAEEIFGGESYTDGVNISSSMIENAGHGGRSAIF